MTPSTPIERIGQMLETAGYRKLPKPLQIAGLAFDIPAAYVGTQPSPDLVLIADTAFEKDQRLLRQIDGIARALDIVKSKRPLTAVIAGPRPSAEVIDSLSKICRVLPVGITAVDDSDSTLNNWLAVLLPLKLPESNQQIADPLGEMAERIHGLRPAIAELVQIAARGAGAVQSRLHDLLKDALASDQDT